MGITTKRRSRVESALFSPVQSELFGLLFGQPEREWMGAELIRQIGRGTGAVHRQLQQLAASGLLTVTRRANQTWYRADPRNPIFEDLRRIVLKTNGLAGPLRQALTPFTEAIAAAFVFGSVAAGKERATSDIDLMIITRTGDAPSYPALYEALGKAERTLARPINPIMMTVTEWHQKRAVDESFAERVAEGEKIMILGDAHDVG